MRLQFLLVAYGAAGISFLASLARDYAVIHYSSQDKLFFQLLYIASMAAGFGVNAIALGSRALGKAALGVLSLLGAIVILVLAPPSSTNPFTLALLISILLMWIAGAQWSRNLIERGWIFSGRIREAIASVILGGLVLAGLGVEPSFLIAVAIGSAFSWLMWRAIRPLSAGPGRSGISAINLNKLVQSILLTNLATFSITYWALVQTGKVGEVFGIEISTAVRFSMYVYQILTIGSVVLVSLTSRLAHDSHLVLLIAAAVAFFFVSLLVPLDVALFLVPLSAAVTHYGVVLYLQQISMARP